MSTLLYCILTVVLLIGFVADWITDNKKHPIRSLVINIILAIVLIPIIYYEIAHDMVWGVILDFLIGISIGYSSAESVDNITNNTVGDENEHTP